MNDVIDWQNDVPIKSHILNASLREIIQVKSLTSALNQFDAEFDVEIRYIGLKTMNPPKENKLFVRDVFLRLNKTPVVWAQSMCDEQALFWQSILNCGKQSLGNFLFQDHPTEIKRSTLEFCFKTHHLCPIQQNLWSRRSIFTSHNESLTIQEVFLPALQEFI